MISFFDILKSIRKSRQRIYYSIAIIHLLIHKKYKRFTFFIHLYGYIISFCFFYHIFSYVNSNYIVTSTGIKKYID